MKCCICGTIKNVGQYLDKIFQNMEFIGSLFETYVIILYYDTSTDHTFNKIRQYQLKNDKLQIIFQRWLWIAEWLDIFIGNFYLIYFTQQSFKSLSNSTAFNLNLNTSVCNPASDIQDVLCSLTPVKHKCQLCHDAPRGYCALVLHPTFIDLSVPSEIGRAMGALSDSTLDANAKHCCGYKSGARPTTKRTKWKRWGCAIK